MPISAFSAQKFYQIATGAPVAREHARISLDLEVPERGLHIVEAAPDGTTLLAVLQGLIAPNRDRERCIRDIELRQIPRPIAHPQPLAARRQAYYLSLNELQSNNRTLASLFGLTELLTEKAERSRRAQCPTCGGAIPVCSTPAELCDELLSSWRGEALEIDLVGPRETTEAWGKEHGFTVRTNDLNLAAARLDSFTCNTTRISQLHPLLASTRRLHDTWLTVRGAHKHTDYAWSGRCSTCSYQMRPFQRSNARTLIERGPNEHTHVEASRVLEGRSLRALLTCSLGDILAEDSLQRVLPPFQQRAIETLALTDLSLGTQTTTLAPHTLAQVTLAAALSPGTASNSIILFDAPRSLFSEEEYNALLAVAETIAQTATVLWISEPGTEPRHTSLFTPHPVKTPLLGTIDLHDSATGPAPIQCGEWLSVNPPHHHQHERFGLALATALHGEPSPLATVSALHSFSVHFIPLFAQDTTTTRLVAHQLGAIEPLAKMFAASHHAKMLGLSPRDFIISQIKQAPSICGSCKGTGLLHATDRDAWQEEIAPCPACWGARFRSPARDVTFKGKTVWEILNSSIASCEQILCALPKMKEVFEVTTLLGLGDIALGTPTALLAPTHRRMLAIVRAVVEATESKPSVIVIEAPFVGIDERLRTALRKVRTHPRWSNRIAWVGIDTHTYLHPH
jgi:hypothetical protein